MFDVGIDLLALLAAAAFIAGFVDAIAGGGGLITVPALLLAGFSPVEALATNKLQGLFGSGSATIAYARNGHVDLRRQLAAAVFAFCGAVAGAALATYLPADMLRAVLPFMLVAIAVYFAFKPNMNDVDGAERLTPSTFAMAVVPLLGFYDGLFGPGAGSFYMLAFVGLAGFGVLKATAHTKLLNFASNLGGFAAFAFAGAVVWKVGLVMGVAQFLGARLGATLAMRIGSRLIKPLLVTVCLALAIRLLLDPANPVRVWVGF